MKKIIIFFLSLISSAIPLQAMEDNLEFLHPLLAKIKKYEDPKTKVPTYSNELDCLLMLQNLHGWDKLSKSDKQTIENQAVNYLLEAMKAQKEGNKTLWYKNLYKAASLCQEEAFVRLGNIKRPQNALLWHLSALTATLIKNGSYKPNHYALVKEICEAQISTDPLVAEFYLSFHSLFPHFVNKLLAPLTTAEARARSLYTFWKNSGLSNYLYKLDINTLLVILQYIGHDPEISKIPPLHEKTFEKNFKTYEEAVNKIENLRKLTQSSSIPFYYDELVAKAYKSEWPAVPFMFGILVHENNIDYDEKGQKLTTDEEKNQTAFALFRRSQTPDAFRAMSHFVEKSLTDIDSKGTPITTKQERLRETADLLYKSEMYESLIDLSNLAFQSLLEKDKKGHPIQNEQDRIQAMYNFLIQAGHWIKVYGDNLLETQKEMESTRLNNLAGIIDMGLPIKLEDSTILTDLSMKERLENVVFYLLKSNCSTSYLNLGICIELELIDVDEQGSWTSFHTKERRLECAAYYYLKAIKGPAPREEALVRLGTLTRDGYYHKDHHGKKIPQDSKKRNEAAAYFFRRARTSSVAFNEIGVMLYLNDIDSDEEGLKIQSQEQRKEAYLRCWHRSEEPQAFYNLAQHHMKELCALLIAQGKRELSADLFTPVKNYLKEAIVRGSEESLDIYNKLDLFIQGKLSTFSVEGLEANFFPAPIKEEFVFPTFDKRELETAFSKSKVKLKRKNKVEKASHRLPTPSPANNAGKQHFRVVWSDVAKEQMATLSINKVKKIYTLIKYIQEEDAHRGRPETLRMYDNLLSRRINQKDRLVYERTPDGIVILSCKEHYKKIGTSPLNN